MSLTLHDAPPALLNSDRVAQQVDYYQSLVRDSNSELHALYYGQTGISGIKQVRVNHFTSMYDDQHFFVSDETEHSVNLDGQSFVVPTFKRRGALLAVSRRVLENPDLQCVQTASSGNHAQAVAAAAKQFGLQSVVHGRWDMSPKKLAAVQRLGAITCLEHDSIGEALVHAEEKSHDPAVTMVHPFNDPDVMAGQGTVVFDQIAGIQRLHASGRLDMYNDEIVLAYPLGGGGFLGGVAIAVRDMKDRGELNENIQVVGLQAEYKSTNTLCDGTATETGPLARMVIEDPRYVDRIHTVPLYLLGRSMLHLEEYTGKHVEPAGALSTAAQHYYPSGTSIFSVISGSSVTDERYNQLTTMHGAQIDQQVEHDIALEQYLQRLGKSAINSNNVWRGVVIR